MKRIQIILAIGLILIHTSGFSQIKQLIKITDQPVQYQRANFDIQLIAEWKNPFLQHDITVDALFKTPSGKMIKVPAYYDSGRSHHLSTWKIRFTPQEAGTYTAYTMLTSSSPKRSTSSTITFWVTSSNRKGFLHAGNNWTFRFDNGEAFRGIGENICWESRANDDSRFFKALHEQTKYNYEYLLPQLKAHGGNYFRTWISRFNLPLDWHNGFNNHRYQASGAYYNPSAIKKMDRLVELADSLGLYIMLTLGPGNYSDTDGGFSPSAADFFVNPLSKMKYRDRLRYIVARWGYSTSIGAWEFFNEVDNIQYGNQVKPISADVIVEWHKEMSAYLKTLDPYNHLVTTSISHRDLEGLNSLAGIDFNQKHIYKNTASIPQTIQQYETNFSKPYVIGEYSYEWDWSKNFDDFALEMDSDFKRGLWYGLFSPTPILPMSWWWEYFDNRKTDTFIKPVRLMADRMMAAGKGNFNELIVKCTDSTVHLQAVKCGPESYIYVFNPSAVAKKFHMSIKDLQPYHTILYFNCESGVTSPLQRESHKTFEGTEWLLPANSDMVLLLK